MSNNLFLQFDGENITPQTVSMGDIGTLIKELDKEFKKQIEENAPRKEEILISLVSIESNCIKMRLNIKKTLHFTLLISVLSTFNYQDFIKSKNKYPFVKPIANFNSIYNSSATITTQINQKSKTIMNIPYFKEEEKENQELSEYTEQTTIYGILEKIGGQKKCKVSIKPLMYNAEFEGEIDKDMGKELAHKLYSIIIFEGRVKFKNDTPDYIYIEDFKQFSKNKSSEVTEKIRKKFGSSYNKIKDPVLYFKNLRNG